MNPRDKRTISDSTEPQIFLYPVDSQPRPMSSSMLNINNYDVGTPPPLMRYGNHQFHDFQQPNMFARSLGARRPSCSMVDISQIGKSHSNQYGSQQFSDLRPHSYTLSNSLRPTLSRVNESEHIMAGDLATPKLRVSIYFSCSMNIFSFINRNKC